MRGFRLTCLARDFLVVLVFWASSCATRGRNDTSTTENTLDKGEALAKKYCGSCHLFPAPELLDKETWANHTLPAMGYRFGIYRDRTRESLLEKGIARRIVEEANIFPATQIIADEEWESIKQYYYRQAPEKLAQKTDTLSVRELSSFHPFVPDFHIPRPAVSAFTYDASKHQLYVADCSREDYSSITILDRSFKPVASLGLRHPVSNLTLRHDTLYMLSMGHFVPSDEPAGELIRAVKDPSGNYEGYQRILKNLTRPVDVAYADLNKDGTDEIVICEFGNHTGSVSLFTKKTKRSFEREILLHAPGAVKVEIEDMDNDNLPDIVVLMAQGAEGLDIYYNMGGGKFQRKRVLEFPPVYGSASFSLTDFNNDGYYDIVYVNGDNADASRIVKPYHGIRIFLNDQHGSFDEAYFLPMPGAYQVVVHDFDKDGDKDIAAISFFVDFQNHPEQGFIYLKNNSQGDSIDFSPHIIKESTKGRWITMIGCDINSDGFQDIVLGSFTSMQFSNDTTNISGFENISKSQPLLVLKNVALRKRK